jgi:hypothetical protein
MGLTQENKTKLNRVYGRRRLSLLLKRWTVERVMGLNQALLDDSVITAPQPVFVLTNSRPVTAANFSDPLDAVWQRVLL